MGKKEDRKKYQIFKIIVEKFKIKGNLPQLREIAILITNEKKYLGKLSRDQKRYRKEILEWFNSNYDEVVELINQIEVIDNKFVLRKNDCQAAFQEENNKISLQGENSNPPIHDENENSNNNFDDININLSPPFDPNFYENDFSDHTPGSEYDFPDGFNSPSEYGSPDDFNSINFGYDFYSQH